MSAAEVDEKLARLVPVVQDAGLGGVLLATHHNIAWLTGGRSKSGSDPASSGGIAALAATSVQWRSTARAGNGSWPVSTLRTASRDHPRQTASRPHLLLQTFPSDASAVRAPARRRSTLRRSFP